MKGTLEVVAIAALAALFLAPAGAQATAPRESMHFSLPASNGYTLQVKTEGAQTLIKLWKGDRDAGRGRDLFSTYYVGESAAPGTIEADLGALGRIDVRFEPSGSTRAIELEKRDHLPLGCRAPRRLIRALGSFSGTISFHGEHGFAAVEAIRAQGSVGPSARPRCRGERPLFRPLSAATRQRRVEHVWIAGDALLTARSISSEKGSSHTVFLVFSDGEKVRYLVDRVEAPRTDLMIERQVAVSGPEGGFAYSGDLRTATLRPPAPFSGEATYSDRGGRLSGDLAVELPGSAPQPLVGPGLEAWIESRR